MAKGIYERTKPASIGHVDHAKTTLTAAIVFTAASQGAPMVPIPMKDYDPPAPRESPRPGFRREARGVKFASGHAQERHGDHKRFDKRRAAKKAAKQARKKQRR